MNKLFAQTLDKLVVSILSPKFNSSKAFKDQNLSLLNKPPLPPKRLIKTPKLFLKKVKVKNSFDIYNYAFPSRVETPHLKNNTVYGRYYKLNNKTPKSTIILLHDIFESRHRYQEKHALNIVKSGHDCLLMTLPYHIERTIKRTASGSQFISTDLSSVFGALQQGVKDVMALINWLTANGEKNVGLMGIGLGGLIAGLVASTTRKINYLILLAPAITPLQIAGYIKSEKIMDGRIEATGLSKDQLFSLFEPWSFSHHKPLAPADRVFIVEALYDTVISSNRVENVWDAWGRPKISKHKHGRLGILASRRVFRDVSRFLDEIFAHQKSAGLLR